ncbi:MAG: intradiol ring-cleavage dioxygenase [Blastopirellula sp.]|nr:MAG: intradiol ring-cleavage dioxygenase [Blastopirellula sp.]
MFNRRQMIQQSAFMAAAMTTPGLFAEELMKTARQTEGPFYPNKLPLDTDNDLLIINDQLTPAVGTIVHLTGRVRNLSGEPIRNAIVEIWQTDNNGVYIHTEARDKDKQDTNFQGFGRFLTNRKGEYYFRTLKPVHYGPRTSHIHLAVKQGSKRLLTTQIYTKGDPKNARDRILQSIEDVKSRNLLIVDYKPLPHTKTGELAAHFDVIVGVTPEDRDDDEGRILPSQRTNRRPRQGS